MDTKIIKFLKKQHILSLCVSDGDEIWACSCFYAYDESSNSLIIASDPQTKHMKIAQKNQKVAINIALDTKIIGLIKGIQAKGEICPCTNKTPYFKRFPYALALNPDLYEIRLDYIKYTDNALKKKIIWEI